MHPLPYLRGLGRPIRHWALALPLALGALLGPAQAAVVISQVFGGGGNTGAVIRSDFIELFNAGSTAEDIGGWSVQYASATSATWAATAIPAGTSLPAGRYYLIQQATGAGGSVSLSPDHTGTLGLAGTAGKVALSKTSAALSGAPPVSANLVDLVAYGSTATGGEGSPTANLSAVLAAQRKGAGCTDTGSNAGDFDVAAPAPRNLATAAAPCAGGGGGGGGGPVATPATIPAIQGSGASSPMAGTLVSTSGVVTLLLNNGFFMQDPVGDGNPATSDGIFVFTGSTAFAAVAPGNLVQVIGSVLEFNTGAPTNADTLAHTVTELTGVSAITLLDTGRVIAPTVVTLPELLNDDLERYEGMLVTLAGPLTVQQNFFQGRYGQLTLASGGRLETPTNRYRPGSPQAVALADENARRRILLDDGSSLQNPNPIPYLGAGGRGRAGDTVASVTGVIDYGLATNVNTGAGDYKIHPTLAPVFSVANPRTTSPAAVGGNVKVGSFNVLNYFTTFTNGQTADGGVGQGCSLGATVLASNCRGANNAVEFGRQRSKIVEAMLALNADVLGLMEIQNNGNTAVQNLVDALNTRLGTGTYASVGLPPQGSGSDAIRPAMIYKPARLAPVGAADSDTDTINNRPTLAQTFSLANGERFTLLVNHLKSKSGCPLPGDANYAGNNDAGDGQGCWNLQRVQQANRLRTYVAQRQAAAGSPDALLIGDFNAYGQEDPIFALTSNGYIDQAGRFGSLAYSYVFDGAAGRLDHAISTATLSARVSQVQHWHINADEAAVLDYNQEFKAPESRCGVGGTSPCPPDPYTATPYRSSDHDPVLVGLSLYKTITGTAGRDVIVGTPGDDIIIGGIGADTLTGGAGQNIFVYQSMRDAGDTVTDFVPGKDQLDLRPLLASLGYTGSNPVADGWVRFDAAGSATRVLVDADGPAGADVFRPLLTLSGVSPAQLQAARDLLVPQAAARHLKAVR